MKVELQLNDEMLDAKAIAIISDGVRTKIDDPNNREKPEIIHTCREIYESWMPAAQIQTGSTYDLDAEQEAKEQIDEGQENEHPTQAAPPPPPPPPAAAA